MARAPTLRPRYDLSTYLPEALIDIPLSASGVESNWTMQRFGQDGIALLSYDSIAEPSPVIQLMLVRGPFVAAQELLTQSAASLTSSSASSIPHGNGNMTLTLTGSNFLPGVAVTWNGVVSHDNDRGCDACQRCDSGE